MYRGLGAGSCLGVLGVAEKLHVWKEKYTGKRGREPNQASEGSAGALVSLLSVKGVRQDLQE